MEKTNFKKGVNNHPTVIKDIKKQVFRFYYIFNMLLCIDKKKIGKGRFINGIGLHVSVL